MSWPTAMACTMPRPIASCVFQRSWPARPGTMNSAARSATNAGDGGSVRRGSIGPRDPLGSPFHLLLSFLGVAAPELLDAARGIDQLLLAGVERVRLARPFDPDHRLPLPTL